MHVIYVSIKQIFHLASDESQMSKSLPKKKKDWAALSKHAALQHI